MDFRRIALAALAATAGTLAIAVAGPASAGAATTWLCKPGVEPNPCYSSLETTAVTSGGASTVESPQIARKPKVDCFYVYPTVSQDQGTNSDLSIDPEQVAVARFQASRFSERCRVFAPMYRQLTLDAIGGTAVPRAALDLAFSDVAAAWREYMKRDNNGRGVVLIGHSQGTGMLTQLVREKIDPFPKARKRLVSALLIGGNVLVKKGRDVGGSFNKVPACRTVKRTGCVVAYSIYDETPPNDTFFGKPEGPLTDAFGLSARTDLEVLCNNPAALAGGTAPLQTLYRRSRSPARPASGSRSCSAGPCPPSRRPGWSRATTTRGPAATSTAPTCCCCRRSARRANLTPVPDPTWGLHLGDVNLALGDLVDLVGAQTRTYAKQRAKRKRLAAQAR